jgi:hypothetical protein
MVITFWNDWLPSFLNKHIGELCTYIITRVGNWRNHKHTQHSIILPLTMRKKHLDQKTSKPIQLAAPAISHICSSSLMEERVPFRLGCRLLNTMIPERTDHQDFN